ncbi:hypothetical protein [Pseudomonas trivialis]|uniref:Uncharacterized protein n=1 Tax=Pseudomonas trivialis TaxID=200450 RepID=A0A0H5A1N5_9PSED|nr:hypothetical protein [Pseudomonas trivialis]AKS04666.1 hypothetical protein AA957_00535 [Pseudomonas trivialis]
MSSKPISKRIWREETADSNRLFAEADHLNTIAYELLSDRPTNNDTVRNFQAAKDAADAKYEEARKAWEKAKVHLKMD